MAKKAAPRRVVQGDRSPVLTPAGIEQFEIGRATEAARLAKVSAIRDVLRTADKEELESVALWLQAILAGTSADEVDDVRAAIDIEDDIVFGVPPMSPDDERISSATRALSPSPS